MPNQILIPHKATFMGFALQTAQGVPKTQPDVLLPIPDGATAKWKRPKTIMQYNDGVYERTNWWTEGESGDLSWTMPWVPGMFACGADPEYAGGWGLASWCWGRDSLPTLTTYAQGFYATLFAYRGKNFGLAYPDAKVSGGTVSIKGNAMVTVDIKAESITTPVAWTPAGSIPHFRLNPFICKESFLGISVPAAAASQAIVTVKDLTLDWDNVMASANDMQTLGTGGVPLGLPNAARPTWKGQFGRWFSVDGESYTAREFYDAYMADTEGDLEVQLIRSVGVASTGALTFPRIVFMDDDIPLPKDGFVEETVQWEALGTTAGAPAFDFAESMGAYGS
jgi:hypothetical protein